MHRCPNPTCPGGGKIKATPGCCSCSPPRCANCEGAHTATHRDCDSRPSPPTLRCSTVAETIVPPPPAGDGMDRAADEDDLSPPASPTRSLQSAFETATRRARSSTILPARLGPPQGRLSLPPREPAIPSPMSRTPSGLARQCSTTRHRGTVSRTPLPLYNPSHSFNTTASGAGMCFFPCSGPSRNGPTLLPLWPCRILLSTGADSPRLVCLLGFPLPQPAAASPG